MDYRTSITFDVLVLVSVVPIGVEYLSARRCASARSES